MNKSLNELVRDQILAEWQQIEDPVERERYVDAVLNLMPHVELLERISDSLTSMKKSYDIQSTKETL